MVSRRQRRSGQTRIPQPAPAQRRDPRDSNGGRSLAIPITVLVVVGLLIGGLVLWWNWNTAIEGHTVEETAAETIVPTFSTYLIEYKDPQCGCCSGWGEDMTAKGQYVEIRMADDMASIKDGFAIPQDLRSCHTTVWEDYFIEGHIPYEVVKKLMDERPDIDGIALPGMPAGSPGMGGAKMGPWEVHAIKDGQDAGIFMTV